MAVVVGINFAIALRLIGWVPQFALNPFQRFYHLHWLGAVIVLLSGLGLLLAYPAKALTNPVFYLKFIALGGGLLIAAWLQKQIVNHSISKIPAQKLKIIAGISIVLWIMAITAGRFLAYTNSVLLASRFF
ncbi:MAG: hypothetical protein OXU66_04255 [Gammaproteobacteria bacterium]|nr:hypothetical protein [Gammaproteobacteria bacterium]MDD9894302.1 hypothetical protein [Gammaproteobacteria bacterium]MDD9958133.1 hypothetical protein [Gammaproteobacteria bacterium]